MADVYLDAGNAFSVHDARNDAYDRTASYQDPSDSIPEPLTRKKNCIDVDLPYIGNVTELALSDQLPDEMVISRDRIVTDARDSWWPFSQSEQDILRHSYSRDFINDFGAKYRREYEDTGIAFAYTRSRSFGPHDPRPVQLFTSEADVIIVANAGDLEDSFDVMREAREEVEDDLQDLADRIVG